MVRDPDCRPVAKELGEFVDQKFVEEMKRLARQINSLGEAVEDQNTVHIKVKKLHPDAKLPTKGSEEAACWDVYALEDTFYSKIQVRAIRTGLALEVPEGYEVEIRPRSGLSKEMEITNSPGTLDSDYRGELLVLAFARRDLGGPIKTGDRIAQIKVNRVLPVEFEEVDELSPTERGDKGFGSTGK